MNGLTRYLCDLIQHNQGKITTEQLRANYRAGEYPGLKPEWAKQYAHDFGIGKGRE